MLRDGEPDQLQKPHRTWSLSGPGRHPGGEGQAGGKRKQETVNDSAHGSTQTILSREIYEERQVFQFSDYLAIN